MKTNKNSYSFLVAGILIFLCSIFSCSDLEVPESITIKTDPVIEASAGTVKASLSDYFSTDIIKDMFAGTDGLEIYDYKSSSSDKSLHFLGKMEKSMPIDGLDISGSLSALQDMDPISFGYESDDTTPKTMFSVPEINETFDLDPIALDFDDEIQDSIDLDSVAVNLNIVEAGTATPNVNIPSSEITLGDDFSTITFNTGTSMNFVFDPITGTTNNYAFNVTKLAIINSTTSEEIATSSTSLNIVNGGTISIDLGNKTLPNKIKINLSGNSTGGTALHSVTLKVNNASFVNLSIKKVTGFSLATAKVVNIPTIDPITLGEAANTLKQAKIGTGKIILNTTGCPTTGVTKVVKMTLTQVNDDTYTGLNISDTSLTTIGSDQGIDLANKYINSKDIAISGQVSLTLSNATIEFPVEIDVTGGIQLNSFSEMYVNVGDVISSDMLTQEYKYSLADVAEMVTKIKFYDDTTNGHVGLKMQICNGLPVDIDLTVNSTALGITDEVKTLTKNQTTLPTTPTGIYGDSGANDYYELDLTSSSIQDANGKPQFDVLMEMSIPGLDNDTKILHITDSVTAGTDYKLYGKAELATDWYSVYVKLSDEYSGYSGSLPEGEPMDLSTISSVLGDIQLADIKANLYLKTSILDLFSDDTKLKAEFTGSYTENSTPKIIYLVGNENTPGVNVTNLENLPTITATNGTYTGSLPTTVSIPSMDFSQVLNTGAKDLTIDYSVKIEGDDVNSGVEILKSAVDSIGDDSPSVDVLILLDIPIVLKVAANTNGYAGINLLEMMGDTTNSETDMLGRTSAGGTEGLDSVFDYINKISLTLNYTNQTGIALDLVLQDGVQAGASPKFDISSSIKDGTGQAALTIDYDAADYIKNTYPFYPDVIELRLPGSKTQDTKYALTKDAKMDVTVTASVETDVNMTIPLASNKGGN